MKGVGRGRDEGVERFKLVLRDTCKKLMKRMKW